MSKVNKEINEKIINHMKENDIVGLAACLVQDGEIIWEGGFGFADIAKNKPMSPDTIQNIASISKTFTNAAIMQLWEQGKIKLEDDVNKYLPFKVKHPDFDTPITTFQLLTHTGAIADSDAYEMSYACGDLKISLEDWVKGYLIPGGEFYNTKENFHDWEPGTNFSYTNVGFGLLGYLVECVSGIPFTQYVKKNIFDPLGMINSGWLMSEVNMENHATLYAVGEEKEEMRPLFVDQDADITTNEPIPLCQYSFPNTSDGLVRTSARELSYFASAYSKSNKDGVPLKAETMQKLFTPIIPAQEVGRMKMGMGLTWFNLATVEKPDDILYWHHSGGDPGVSTLLILSLKENSAVVILTNSNHGHASLEKLAEMIWSIK